MLARGSEMVSELSFDLFSQSNNVIWTEPYLGFDWFGTILGAFLSTESVLLVSLFKRDSPNLRSKTSLIRECARAYFWSPKEEILGIK